MQKPKPILAIEYWIATVWLPGAFVAGIVGGVRELLSYSLCLPSSICHAYGTRTNVRC